MEFVGDCPYVLVLLTPDPTAIDIDEPGWAQTYAHLLRKPGHWILARKAGSVPVLELVVHQGEQPYYTSRVVGVANLPPPDALGVTQEEMFEIKERGEVRAYGIGKKRLDGHVDRLWVLPTGVICGGEDVDALGENLARARLLQAFTKEVPHGDQEGREEVVGQAQG